MDAVQRAFESQIRRDEYKRVQLQNAVRGQLRRPWQSSEKYLSGADYVPVGCMPIVSLEEERLLREREKEERERIRQHMSAAQHLQRLQVGRNYPGEMRKTPAARFRFNVIALHRWRVFTLMPARVVDYTFVSARACVHM
eukprot:1141672-Prorocentrum_minimum.AAC.2